MSSGCTLSTKDFEYDLIAIETQKVPALLEKGITLACVQWLKDCLEQVPTVPIDTGRLRSSGSVFVDNILKAKSPEVMRPVPRVHGDPSPATTHVETLRPDKHVGIVGWNTEYAKKVHEAIETHFREPGSGALFLSTKAANNGNKYMGIIADVLHVGVV